MLKVAMIGKWHVHAEGYANDFNTQPDSKVVCVWADDRARGSAWAEKLQVPFYENLDVMFAKENFDAVCVCTATSQHKEVYLKAAQAHKHIFTEKVMCLSVDDCDEAIKAIQENKVVFTISFPHRSLGCNLFIKRTIEEGALGDITLMRVRICHDGALKGWLPEYWFDPKTTGGGAMMDLGAHPMYLSAWMLGKPKSVTSSFKYLTGKKVDDDALCVIEFENGARALVETSLIAPYNPQIMEIYGTKGVILCHDGKLRMRTTETGDWIEPQIPQSLPSPLRQFTDSVLYGKPVLYGCNEARQLTLMMQRAYLAEASGKNEQM